ncbi:MAG: hypothetical protein LH470_05570 [Lysobacter sp.]|nr:hypothetical protein [Lysobacter sp.]
MTVALQKRAREWTKRASLYYWQNVRKHLASGGQMELASTRSIPALFDSLAQSPAFKPALI